MKSVQLEIVSKFGWPRAQRCWNYCSKNYRYLRNNLWNNGSGYIDKNASAGFHILIVYQTCGAFSNEQLKLNKIVDSQSRVGDDWNYRYGLMILFAVLTPRFGRESLPTVLVLKALSCSITMSPTMSSVAEACMGVRIFNI